jgi:glycosyltransferase involved in cell wall biosynthesis
VRYPRGHGQSYSLNTGVYAARGRFVTFLDDDDFWTDMYHLEKANKALVQNPEAEVYYANQLAMKADSKKGEVIWLGDLENICHSTGRVREQGVYQVDVELLMRSRGFAHLNCSIVSRDLFVQIKGMDEDIRWECDRDFYLRTIDNAKVMLFNPDVVSQHNVPDKTKSKNMTTAISFYQRLNYQIYVLNKIAMLASNPLIIRHARKHKIYALKKIAETMKAEGRYSDALYFSSQALGMNGSWKWWLWHFAAWGQRVLNGRQR